MRRIKTFLRREKKYVVVDQGGQSTQRSRTRLVSHVSLSQKIYFFTSLKFQGELFRANLGKDCWLPRIVVFEKQLKNPGRFSTEFAEKTAHLVMKYKKNGFIALIF